MIGSLCMGFVMGWVGSMPLAGAVSIFVFQYDLISIVCKLQDTRCTEPSIIEGQVWIFIAEFEISVPILTDNEFLIRA